MKSKNFNIDLHTWHYHATSASLFVFSHGIMALGYFVQFLKEVTLALLIHFFWRWNKLMKKCFPFAKAGQRALGWNEHIYWIHPKDKHQTSSEGPHVNGASGVIWEWGLNSMSRSMLKTSWCFTKGLLPSWGGKGFGHHKTAG
jgi:hypothetical protein